MKLYLVRRTDSGGYDTYDSFISCNDTIEEARLTQPDKYGGGAYNWTTPANVEVTEIGEANSSVERGVVLASYNAG